MAQAVYLPQVVDAIADEEFAEEFRKLCKEKLQYDPPKRSEKYNLKANIDGIDTNVPEYVKFAVNWWANAIVNPRFDNGDSPSGMAFFMAMMVNTKSSISKEQLAIFKKTLANGLIDEVVENGRTYRLHVDYSPDDYLLYKAAREANIDDTISFPWKTTMYVNQHRVSVSYGYGAPLETLWEKKED